MGTFIRRITDSTYSYVESNRYCNYNAVLYVNTKYKVLLLVVKINFMICTLVLTIHVYSHVLLRIIATRLLEDHIYYLLFN